MIKACVLVLALVGLFACGAKADNFDDVVPILTEDDFDDHVADNSHTLCMFYAPWCGHCKRFKPDFAEAHTELKGTASLVGVDCTEETELCARFDVKGYPTIKWFSGDAASVRDYDGGRTKKDVLKWIDTQTSPAVTQLDDVDAVSALYTGKDGVFVVGFFDAESKGAATFAKVAENLRGEAKFGQAPAALAAEFDATSIVLFRSFDEPKLVYDGKLKKKSVQKWIEASSFPLVGEIGPDNYKKYMDRGLPLFWLNVDVDDEDTEAIIDLTREVAKDFSTDLSFVILDGVKYENHAKSMGLSGKLPGAIIDAQPKKFVFSDDDEFDVENLKTFAQNWKDGKLEPNLKSEDIPASNDEGVFVLVGKQWDEIVVNSGKNVFVEFYAPWCGHCKSLAPEYDLVGEEFADDDSVIVAKMDSTANDNPAVDVKGFPTLVFFPAGAKQHKSYEGERNAKAIIAYINDNKVAVGHDEL
jgi:protein disulfide-isomerase A1